MSRRQSDPMRRLPILIIVSLFVFLAFGCGGGGGGSGSDSDEGTPSISTQGVLDFGTAVIPNAPARVLTVINNGTGNLAIGPIALQQAGTPFAIAADGCSNQTITPTGTCQVTVQLNSTGYAQTDFANTLSIPSNAPGSPLALAMEGKVRKYLVSINEVTKNCPTVELLVSVVDGTGASVAGLEDFFSLLEDGTPQAIIPPVTYQSSGLSVVLLLDNSTSIANLDVIQSAANAFIDRLKPTDEAAVLKFAKTTDPADFSFTTNKTTLKALVDAPFTGDTEGTILYDVVYSAIDALNTDGSNPYRAVVVLSDGLDVGSGSTLPSVITFALQAGIPVYSIAITEAVDPQPLVMKQLAEGTYGVYFEAPSASAVEGIYSQIAGILSDQYLIQYDSASSGGSPIDLDVFVEGPLPGDKGEASRDAVAGCP